VTRNNQIVATKRIRIGRHVRQPSTG
jgi:hypothetical protein